MYQHLQAKRKETASQILIHLAGNLFNNNVVLQICDKPTLQHNDICEYTLQHVLIASNFYKLEILLKLPTQHHHQISQRTTILVILKYEKCQSYLRILKHQQITQRKNAIKLLLEYVRVHKTLNFFGKMKLNTELTLLFLHLLQ